MWSTVGLLGQGWDIGVLSIWLAHEALRRGEMVRIKERAKAGPGPPAFGGTGKEVIEGTHQRNFAEKGSGEMWLQASKDMGPRGCFFLKLGDARVDVCVAERETSRPKVDLLVR